MSCGGRRRRRRPVRLHWYAGVSCTRASATHRPHRRAQVTSARLSTGPAPRSPPPILSGYNFESVRRYAVNQVRRFGRSGGGGIAMHAPRELLHRRGTTVYAIAVVLVFNLSAGAVLVVSAAVALIANAVGLELGPLVAGFAAMTIVGGALELQPKPSWRPRYFWIVPAWLIGLTATGIALLEASATTAGYAALGAAAFGFVALIAYAMIRKPGARWLAGLIGASTIVTGFQLLGYFKPEWKHPVLYAVNAVALVAVVWCSVKLYRARKQRQTPAANRAA